MKCPKCSKEIADNAVFCGFCGTSLINKVNTPEPCICPQCQTENKPGSKFCFRCGTNLGLANPEGAAKPEVAVTPEEITKPEFTVTPEEVAKPEVTVTPEEIAKPEVTVTPEEIEKPVVILNPEDLTSPETAKVLPVILPDAYGNNIPVLQQPVIPEEKSKKSGKSNKVKKSKITQEAVGGKKKKRKGKVIAFFIVILLFTGLGGTAGYFTAKQGIDFEKLLLGKSEIAWLQYNPQEVEEASNEDASDETTTEPEEKNSEDVDSTKESVPGDAQASDADNTLSGDTSITENEGTLPGDTSVTDALTGDPGTNATGIPTQTPEQPDTGGIFGNNAGTSQQGATTINLIGSWNAQEFYEGELDGSYNFRFSAESFVVSDEDEDISYNYHFNEDTMEMIMIDTEGDEELNFYLQVTDENTFRMYQLFNINEESAGTQDYLYTPDGKAYKSNDYIDFTRIN